MKRPVDKCSLNPCPAHHSNCYWQGWGLPCMGGALLCHGCYHEISFLHGVSLLPVKVSLESTILCHSLFPLEGSAGQFWSSREGTLVYLAHGHRLREKQKARGRGRKRKIAVTHNTATEISIVRNTYSIFLEWNFDMCTMGARLGPESCFD